MYNFIDKKVFCIREVPTTKNILMDLVQSYPTPPLPLFVNYVFFTITIVAYIMKWEENMNGGL